MLKSVIVLELYTAFTSFADSPYSCSPNRERVNAI